MAERTITVELTPDEIDAVCTAAESNFVSTGPLPAEESGVTKLRAALKAALSSDHQGGPPAEECPCGKPDPGIKPGGGCRCSDESDAAEQPPAPRGLSEEDRKRARNLARSLEIEGWSTETWSDVAWLRKLADQDGGS